MVPKVRKILFNWTTFSRESESSGDSRECLGGCEVEFDADRVLANARLATTEDLLDRVTVYRHEMEPAALPIIEAEIASRGISVDDVEAHLKARKDVVAREDGTVVKCARCHRPAVFKEWGWHRMFGKVPIFPRRFAWCEEHRPGIKE